MDRLSDNFRLRVWSCLPIATDRRPSRASSCRCGSGCYHHFFAETFGGALFVSVGNNILNNELVQRIGALNILSVDTHGVVKLGVTQPRSYVPETYVAQTVVAYNQTLVKTFQVALVVACLSALGAVDMEWKSVLSTNGRTTVEHQEETNPTSVAQKSQPTRLTTSGGS